MTQPPDDPRGALLLDLVRKAGADDEALTRSILALPGLALPDLAANAGFVSAVQENLAHIRRDGLRAAITTELNS
ncbi:hypothetical protein ACFSS8_04975 [Paracoccus kondratievae]